MNEPANQSSSNKTLIYILGGCLVVFVCLACIAIIGFGGLAYYIYTAGNVAVAPTELVRETAVPPTIAILPTATPIPPTVERETAPPTTDPPPAAAPTVAPTLAIAVPEDVTQLPIPARAFADLEALYETDYPAQDYFETAVRLGRQRLDARTVASQVYNLNDTQTFQTDAGEITAVLMAATDHLYFWVDDRLDYPQPALAAAAERLEKQYYPRLLSLFGQEWQPGVDNDPHFSILHLSGDGSASELGFFSSADEYPRQIYSESNQQEVVYLIMGPLEQGEDLYYGTMVHEVQHLIQWYMDPNETTWLSEGLSQLAEIYMGLDTADTYDYLQQPDIQLNRWNYDENVVDAHYAGTYLYLVYLWEQLGEDAIRELARHPANGMAGVRAILGGYAPDRSLTQFTADWAAANYLDDPAAGPKYYYRNLDFGRLNLEERLRDPDLDETKELAQFGVHYIDLDYRGDSVVTFAGDTVQNLIDAPPRSGQQMWFAPPLDESSLQLTAVFDLTNLDRATLKFSTWFDLEDDYDFAYLSISTDNGATWELLTPDTASAGEFGPGFNGRSDRFANSQGGWLKESISLNSYVGRTAIIRFEVLTDSAVTGKGFALDDISIPELGYRSDVEAVADGWQADGFVQTGWQIPQQWAVQLIEENPNPTITSLPLNELNQGQWSLTVGKGGIVLVITPLTPFTADPATYWLQVK